MGPRVREGQRHLAVFIACAAVGLATACKDSPKNGSSGRSGDSSPGGSSDSSSARTTGADALPALLELARAKGEKTWPGAKMSGIKIGDEVPPGERRNVYSVRILFTFDADAEDPKAKSGSVVCSSGCQIIRHPAKSEATAWPACGIADALRAARAAGLSSAQPEIGYGSWNDGAAAWSFKELRSSSKSIGVDGVTCAVKP